MNPGKKYVQTELEKLLKIDRKLVEKKLREFKNFYHDKKPFETLTLLQKAKVLTMFIDPLAPEELVEIVESCGCLPKSIFSYDPDALDMGLLFEKGIGQCMLFSFLYKILAQHLGMHNEKKGCKCVIAFSDQSDHALIHFYIPWRGKKILHIIDPTNRVFDKKPKKYWKAKNEPATELPDKIAVGSLQNSNLKDARTMLAWHEANKKIFENNALFWLSKGNAHRELKENDKAMECFNISLSMEPTFATKVLCEKSELLTDLGKYDKAADCLEKALSNKINTPRVALSICMVLRKTGKLDDSLEGYDTLLGGELNQKERKNALHGKGMVLLELGQYQAALDCFNECLKLDPKCVSLLSNKGFALSRLGKTDDALKCFDLAIHLDPEDELVWVNKGDTLRRIGQFEEAIQCFDKALDLSPNFGQALYCKGTALIEEGDALIEKGEALIKKGDDSSSEGRKFVSSGEICLSKALLVLADASEIMPKNEDVFLKASIAFSLTKQAGLAFSTVSKAIELMKQKKSEDEDAWLEATNVLYSIGMPEQALETVERLISIIEKKSNAERLSAALVLKGEILKRMGK